MSSTIRFPEQQVDLQSVADACFERVLQLEAGPIREVAREAARKAPIRLHVGSVSPPTMEAIEALRLESRVLDVMREEIGEERFRAESNIMGLIDGGLCKAANRLTYEAIEERVRELSEPDGTPIVEPSVCEN